MVPLESLAKVSYLHSHSIVTMAVSCVVSETERDIGQKSQFFIPLALCAPVRRVPVAILPYRLVLQKLEWCGYDNEKSLMMC